MPTIVRYVLPAVKRDAPELPLGAPRIGHPLWMSAADKGAIEGAYIDELVRLVARNRDGIRYARHRVVGRYPDTQVVILFEVPLHSACLYGVRDPIWAEDDYTSVEEASRSAGYTWDRIDEIVVAHPIELPSTCQPDDEGVTWVELWSDE